VLFSDQTISDFINENFEASWESVRPVPKVTIDFGNGTVVHRTLHGNVATYVCRSDSTVLDVLPGIYEPETYLERLEELTFMAERLRVNEGVKPAKSSVLTDYHRSRVEEILDNENLKSEAKTLADLTKDDRRSTAKRALAHNLKMDTEFNESERRLLIHRHLIAQSRITPTELMDWLYREVLHADLEDPYLGLKHVLFDRYPFED